MVAPGQHAWCGTIQGVVDRYGTGMIQNVGVVPGHRGTGLGDRNLLGFCFVHGPCKCLSFVKLLPVSTLTLDSSRTLDKL